VQQINLRASFEKLDERLKVGEVEVLTILRVCTLDQHQVRCQLAGKYDIGPPHLEQPHEVLLRGVNVQSSTQLFHLLKRQSLVVLFAGRLPALLYPDRMSDLRVSKTCHEFLSYCVELSQGNVPKLK
jgi:hypothetical protein